MPSDGVLSITVVDPLIPSYSMGTNSPTHYAGDTGTVVLPPPVPMSSATGIVSIVVISTLLGFLALRRRGSGIEL